MIVMVYSFSLISFIQTFNELGNLTLQRLAFFVEWVVGRLSLEFPFFFFYICSI